MTAPPPQGHMYLFDSATPPLDDGSYRLTAETDVTYGSTEQSYSSQSYFDVVGPRFSVPPGMVATTFPPTNGHGSFQDSLPHIVLSRRTLPWERPLDPQGLIGNPTVAPGDPPPPAGPTPWVALLVFEEGEYTLLRGIPLQQAVPADVFTRLGSPTGVTCDAVEAELSLINDLMPSVEELSLLAHVRWVNVDDRELNVAGGDGYFSVVVANRLPAPGTQCRAILVSLEERSDLVPANAPPAAGGGRRPPILEGTEARALTEGTAQRGGAGEAEVLTGEVVDQLPNPIFGLSQPPAHEIGPIVRPPIVIVGRLRARLVALTSWQFTCEGPGTFRELMQNLDVAMIGTVADVGHPALTDTGHLQLELQDRLGASEQVWYRGPLVPYNLTRDSLGPYHSADQARRVTPETGAEDISYSAAFETGRLLAAADPRFAQAIMSWRRESYKQSARSSTITSLATRMTLELPSTQAQILHTAISPIVGTAASAAVVESKPPQADAYGLGKVAAAPGLQASNLQAAWGLASTTDAEQLLGADPGTLGAVVTPPAESARADTTLGAVASDTAALERLAAARAQAVTNATTILEEG